MRIIRIFQLELANSNKAGIYVSSLVWRGSVWPPPSFQPFKCQRLRGNSLYQKLFFNRLEKGFLNRLNKTLIFLEISSRFYRLYTLAFFVKSILFKKFTLFYLWKRLYLQCNSLLKKENLKIASLVLIGIFFPPKWTTAVLSI